jgi:hypothetical protein
MIIYKAMYCPNLYESGYVTISVHRSIEGAKKAIKAHENQRYVEYLKLYGDEKEFQEMCPFGQDEDWKVKESKLED